MTCVTCVTCSDSVVVFVSYLLTQYIHPIYAQYTPTKYMAAPFHLSWFLHASSSLPSSISVDLLPYLLTYHTPVLSPPFLRAIHSSPRLESKLFFTALADQLVPSRRIPTAPTTCVTEDSRRYFERVGDWGVERDLGNLRKRDVMHLDKSKVEEEMELEMGQGSEQRGGGVAFDVASELGELPVLFMTLRCLRDPDVVLRSRAFLMCRMIVLNVMDRHLSKTDNDNDKDNDEEHKNIRQNKEGESSHFTSSYKF